MLNQKLRSIFAGENDLGNKLHNHYIYHLSKSDQIIAKNRFLDLLNNYSDEKFIDIAPDDNSKTVLKKYIYCKNEPNWRKVTNKFLKGIIYLLEREINKQQIIECPKDINLKIKNMLSNLPFYSAEDIINIHTKKYAITVDYIIKEFSPEYDGNFKLWRDTQAKFIIYFDKNLFVWDYINVHKSLRGKGIGTKLAKLFETTANNLGITRYSVEYPNRKYWIKKMNYSIPYKYRIGAENKYSYTHEGYKEL